MGQVSAKRNPTDSGQEISADPREVRQRDFLGGHPLSGEEQEAYMRHWRV